MTRKETASASLSDTNAFFGIIDFFLTILSASLYVVYLFGKAIVTRKPLEKHSEEELTRFKTPITVSLIVGIVCFVLYLIEPAILSVYIFVGVVTVLVVSIVYWRKYAKRKALTSDLDKYLLRALEVMDSTGKWYNDENEANRELVSCLKSQNVDAVYQYRLSNGRVADIRVGDCLIEGKLSPTVAEVDRLLGQMGDYLPYASRLNIVVYGELTGESRRRIENEIHTRYPGQVFLTSLSNPQRQRV